jgi:kynureninase
LVFENYTSKELLKLFDEFDIEVDEREPNIIRVSPAPLYNSFNDVWKFYQILKKILK